MKKKGRRIFSVIIVAILIVAMLVPMALTIRGIFG